MSSEADQQPGRKNRTGLILAAGFGSRQAPSGDVVPKPLLPVAGRELLLRTLDALGIAGCTRVVIVLGHRIEEMKRFLSERYDGPIELETVLNSEFQLGNGISVLSAREHLPDHFILSMADHVFDNQVMEVVARNEVPDEGAAVVVDRKLDSILDMDDATKVESSGRLVRRIGKDLSDFDAVDCGLFLASSALMDALQAVVDRRGDASLSEGVQALADRGLMECIDLGEAWWQDVDTPEMLEAAERRLTRPEPPSMQQGTVAVT